MNRFRAAAVIARRDFTATVLSRAFLLFLLAPLFPLLLGGLFGGIGARVATQTTRPVIAVIATEDQFLRIARARDGLAEAVGSEGIVRLERFDPEPDPAAQQRRLLASADPPIRAVLFDPTGRPRLAGDARTGDSSVRQLSMILAQAASDDQARTSIAVSSTRPSTGSVATRRALTAQVGQMLLFFLTLLLSGMVLSQLIEEKSNKIIEVIAAAVPIDALFLGKLAAMLGASLLGIAVWASAGAGAIALLSDQGLGALPVPAVGWPVFLALTMVYFALNYLLLGAVFLGIGSQASTAREVQTLSMPVTFAQVIIFGFASLAIGVPNAPEALAAAAFPLSSPLVMIARAAELPELWPHLLAVVWQLLWVALIVRVAARLFRLSVLKSGAARRSLWTRLRGTARRTTGEAATPVHG